MKSPSAFQYSGSRFETLRLLIGSVGRFLCLTPNKSYGAAESQNTTHEFSNCVWENCSVDQTTTYLFFWFRISFLQFIKNTGEPSASRRTKNNSP